MPKIILTDFESFSQSLKDSVGESAWAIISSKLKSDLPRLWQQCLTVNAGKRLLSPGKCHLVVELCAPKQDSEGLLVWWEIYLIHFDQKESYKAVCCSAVKASDKDKIQPSIPVGRVGCRPPPNPGFVPIPKTEVGGCARSDSLVRSLIF